MLRFYLMQRGGWGLPCKFTEVPNHVHVVVVLGGMGDLSPTHGTLCSETKSMTEASDAGQGLWGHTGVVKGSSLKLAKANAHLSGDTSDLETRFGHGQQMKRFLYWVNGRKVRYLPQKIRVQRCCPLGEGTCIS